MTKSIEELAEEIKTLHDEPIDNASDNQYRASQGKVLGHVTAFIQGADLKVEGSYTVATDMLANVMHWAQSEGWSFDEALRVARDHFHSEEYEDAEE